MLVSPDRLWKRWRFIFWDNFTMHRFLATVFLVLKYCASFLFYRMPRQNPQRWLRGRPAHGWRRSLKSNNPQKLFPQLSWRFRWGFWGKGQEFGCLWFLCNSLQSAQLHALSWLDIVHHHTPYWIITLVFFIYIFFCLSGCPWAIVSHSNGDLWLCSHWTVPGLLWCPT